MAALQWRLLVSKLQMLSEATGPALLASQLESNDPQTELCRRVLIAVHTASLVVFLIAQSKTLNLASLRFGQLGHKLNEAGVFVGCQMRLYKGFDFFFS